MPQTNLDAKMIQAVIAGIITTKEAAIITAMVEFHQGSDINPFISPDLLAAFYNLLAEAKE